MLSPLSPLFCLNLYQIISVSNYLSLRLHPTCLYCPPQNMLPPSPLVIFNLHMSASCIHLMCLSRSLDKIGVIALFYISLLFLITLLSSYCILPFLKYILKPCTNYYRLTVPICQCCQKDPHIRIIPIIHNIVIYDTIIQIPTTSLHFSSDRLQPNTSLLLSLSI